MIDCSQFNPTPRKFAAAFPASLSGAIRADRLSNHRRARELLLTLRDGIRMAAAGGGGVAGGFSQRGVRWASRFDMTKLSGCVLDLDATESGGITTISSAIVAGSDFSSASWGKNSVTVIADDTAAPDSTTTADRCTASATAGTSRVLQTLTNATTSTCRREYTFYVKRNDVDWIFLETRNSGAASDRTWFNINTGAVGTVGSNHSGASITSVGNGWWLVNLVCNLSANANFGIYLSSADTVATGPTTGQYVWLWGASVFEVRITSIVNRASMVFINQGVANGQPGLYQFMNGRSCIRFFGTTNGYLLATETPVISALSGEDPSFTIMASATSLQVGALAMLLTCGNSGFSSDHERYFGINTTSGGRYTAVTNDDAGVTVTANNATVPDSNHHVLEWFCPGTVISLQVDGASASPSSGAWNVGTVTPDRVGIGIRTRATLSAGFIGYAGRLGLYNRSLSAAERSYNRVGLGNQFAIAVTP